MFVLFYMLYLLSSPYLLVIGDDRVRSTHDQMMFMQVVLMELSCEERIARESFIFTFICFEISCKPIRYLFYNILVLRIMDLSTLYLFNKF